MERSWRVAATRMLSTLPELAGLNERGLGVVAGQLRRCRLDAGDTIAESAFDGFGIVTSGGASINHAGRADDGVNIPQSSGHASCCK